MKRTQRRGGPATRILFEALESRRLLSTNVLTWHDDAGRTGLNSTELSLTQSNVNSSAFGRLFSYAVTGQVYAQPLYAANVAIPGQGTHNVVFVATETNDVYALDANTNTGASAGVLWHVNLGLSATVPNNFFGNRYGPYHDIFPQVGITGTPVIDLTAGTLYLDAFTNDVAGQDVYSHHIHALNIYTGADRVTPKLVAAAVQGNGVGGNGTTVTFSAEHQLQRVAMTLLNGVLYTTYGGYADTDPYHGWMLGFNPTTLALQSVFNTTPNLLGTSASSTSDEGGIWMAGAGPASDGTNMFLLVGNGDFSVAKGDYGDAVVKISTDTSTQASPNINGYGLKVSDYFEPFNQQALSDADADLGSGGGIVLPDQPGAHPHEYIGAGKQGTVYVVNRDAMSGYNATDQVIQTVSLGHGVWGSPAYFNSSIYYQAVGDVLKRYALTNGLLSAAPSAQGTSTVGSFGSTPSISSNGTANGIAWTVAYDGTHQVLHAYNATTLAELYNSNQNTARDQMGAGVKFITPTIADGEVFAGATGSLSIYGLLTPVTAAPATPTSLVATALGAQQVQLTWVRNSNNDAGFKIERATGTGAFAQIGVADASTTSFLDSSVSPTTAYHYRIRATNVIGDSPYSTTADVTTPAVPGAVQVWHFDEGSGLATAEPVGGNNGTLVGSPKPLWQRPGKSGVSSLAFFGDGTYNHAAAESGVQVTTDLSSILGSTSSLDVWFKTTQVGSATHWQAPAITGVDQFNGTNDIEWGTLDAAGRIGIWVGNSGGLYSNSPVNDGVWHNLAITRSASAGVVQLYIDGNLNGSATFETGNKNSSFKLIGALTDTQADGVTVTGANYFNGNLDELRLYNQVIGSNDIQSLTFLPTAPTLNSVTAASGPVVHLTFSNTSGYTQNLEVDRKVGSGGIYAPIATLASTATVYDDTNVTAGTQYFYVVKATDLAGSSPVSNEMSVTPPVPTIVGRSAFYNHSVWDGQNGSSNLTDMSAVDSTKQALLPGQTASFANMTSSAQGINGIIIDVANMEFLPRLEDFTFLVGNNSDPSTWTQAPTPTYVNAYPGRGPGGSTQITLVWDDFAISNEWLQVTMLAQPHLNLPANDVFYFGNLIGYTNTSPAGATAATVTISDTLSIRFRNLQSANVTSPYDINRDGSITISDVAAARANNLQSIQFITPPVVASGGAKAAVVTKSSAKAAAKPAAARSMSPASAIPPIPQPMLPAIPATPKWLKSNADGVLLE